MTDRIRLAVAMGWTRLRGNGQESWIPPANHNGARIYLLPNPFEDANDDYAVLEWARNLPETQFSVFMSYFAANRRMRSWQYQIGDYARAALKVINHD